MDCPPQLTTRLFSTIRTRLVERLLADLRNSNSSPPVGGSERISKVGVGRLELPASASRTLRSSHLSYTPYSWDKMILSIISPGYCFPEAGLFSTCCCSELFFLEAIPRFAFPPGNPSCCDRFFCCSFLLSS